MANLIIKVVPYHRWTEHRKADVYVTAHVVVSNKRGIGDWAEALRIMDCANVTMVIMCENPEHLVLPFTLTEMADRVVDYWEDGTVDVLKDRHGKTGVQ